MDLEQVEHLRKIIDEEKVRPKLQDHLFFRTIISICLDLNNRIYTKKGLAKVISVPIPRIELWKLGRQLPPPSSRTQIFNWIREDLDRKLRIKQSRQK